ALYAAGSFDSAGGSTAFGIARWSGFAWISLPDVSGNFTALASHDDGTGLALYVTGHTVSVNRQDARRIARWNGAEWSMLGNGLGGVASEFAVLGGSLGEGLVVIGHTILGPVGDSYISKWGCATRPVTAFCAGDGTSGVDCPGGAITGAPGNNNDGSNGIAGCANSASSGGGVLGAKFTDAGAVLQVFNVPP